MVAEALDDDEKETISLTESLIDQGLSTANPGIRIILVNEAGMYSVTGRSTKPIAKKFWKRVRTEILPVIRKTGHYGEAPALPSSPRELALLVIAEADRADAEKARADALEVTVAKRDESLSVASVIFRTMTPMADSMTITEMAKLFGMSPPDVFRALRLLEYLYQKKLVPMQEFMDDKKKGAFFEYKYNYNNERSLFVRPIGVVNVAIHFVKEKIMIADTKYILEDMETRLYAIDVSKLGEEGRAIVEKTKKRLDKMKADALSLMFPGME
jgi:DNA-binding transcriptional regulator GbsR (MarR family)